ncbi:MAG: alanine racemase [Bauldia sp.]
MEVFATGADVAAALRPDEPVYCFRPRVLVDDAKAFSTAFPGTTAYAVKTNGEAMVLKALSGAGIGAFDVASPAEFAAARAASPRAELFYMHPVKAESHIRLALERYGIHTLVADHEDEVAKVQAVVKKLGIDPAGLRLFVRLATKGHAAYELSKKFGAAPAHAVEIVQRAGRAGFQVGLCFHVGSQVEDLTTYERALASAAWVRSRAGVEIAALDIGGGFPARYAASGRRAAAAAPPDPARLLADILNEIREWGLDDLPLIAEPGRVIVARAFSVIVRVLLRKGRRLYINDGIWSSLSDSWTGKITLPARHLPDVEARTRRKRSEIVPFRVMGATCDSVDILSRPFYLPEKVTDGDWIEIGHIGAYSMALRTHFNGFYPNTFVEVTTPFEDAEAGPAEGSAAIESMAEAAG